MPLLFSHLRGPSSYERRKAFGLSKLSEKWRGLFYTTEVVEVDNFLSVDCDRTSMTVKSSLMRHQYVALAVLAARTVEQNMVVGYNHSSLVYASLCCRQNRTVLYDRCLIVSQGRRSRNARIASLRKAWIAITLKCRVDCPCPVLCFAVRQQW